MARCHLAPAGRPVYSFEGTAHAKLRRSGLNATTRAAPDGACTPGNFTGYKQAGPTGLLRFPDSIHLRLGVELVAILTEHAAE